MQFWLMHSDSDNPERELTYLVKQWRSKQGNNTLWYISTKTDDNKIKILVLAHLHKPTIIATGKLSSLKF